MCAQRETVAVRRVIYRRTGSVLNVGFLGLATAIGDGFIAFGDDELDLMWRIAG